MGRAALLFIFLGAGLALFSTARANDFGLPEPETKGEKEMVLEKQAFALINDYRHDHDLAELTWNDTMAETARAHSRDMAQGTVDFGHEGFSDRVRHLREAIGPVASAGENVFMSSDPRDLAKLAVETWLHSPPHLHNIRGDFTLSGIGVWESPEGVGYFTQLFMRPAPPPPPQAAGGVMSFPGLGVGLMRAN